MKVLHIITSLGSGGAEGMLYRLIKSSKDSVEHSVICLNKGGKYAPLMKKNGVDVLVLNFRYSSLISGILKILKFSYRKKKDGYKILTSWLYHADMVAWFIRLIFRFDKLFWNIRYTKLQYGRPILKNYIILKILSLLSYFYVKGIISCSKSAYEIHKKLGYKKDIFKIIPNGYYVNQSSNFNPALKVYNGVLRICLIARWHPQKDFENLFQALDLLNYKNIDYHLTIAGNRTGKKNKELISLINKYDLNDKCTLLGEVENVDKIYSQSHITILPSSHGEAFPNVLVESMINFTPCISTDVGDSAHIISNTGLVVPVRDYKSLADAIVKNLIIIKDKNDVYLDNCAKVFDLANRNYNINDISNSYLALWKGTS